MSSREIRDMKQELDQGQTVGSVIVKRIKMYDSISQMESITDLLLNYLKGA